MYGRSSLWNDNFDQKKNLLHQIIIKNSMKTGPSAVDGVSQGLLNVVALE